MIGEPDGINPAPRASKRRRIRVHVSPEGPGLQQPGACAVLRLLDPYSSPRLADDFEVSFAQRGAAEPVDILVLQRDAWASATLDDVHACVRALRLAGGKIAYDVDDNLLDPYVDPVFDSLLRRYRPVIRYLLREADRVTVSTPMLRERCMHLNPRIEVMPNFINPERFAPIEPRADNPMLTIGYYGTFTHERGLTSIIAPLRAAIRKIKPAPRVVFCGVGRNARMLEALEGCCRIEVLPTQANYFSFLRMMTGQRWDIGLAPLTHGIHEDCKSDLKFLEYGALGIPGIYSRSVVYSSVKDGETGLLAEGEEWTDAILRVAHDADLRARIAANAREYAVRERSISAGAPILRDILLRTLNS